MSNAESDMNKFLVDNKIEIMSGKLDIAISKWEANLIKDRYPKFYEQPNKYEELVENVKNLILSNREQDYDFSKDNYVEDTFSNVEDGEIAISGDKYVYKSSDYYFEWDILHSKKHGLTIDKVAESLIKSDKYPVLDTRNNYGERRYRMLGSLDDNNYLCALIYKYTPNCIRIITAIKISKERYNRYYESIYKREI